jgi:Amt family ammonium transporter
LVSGAVAGLVAITPACGFVTPLASIIIGLVSGVLCYFMIAVVKGKLGYDDSLDAFGMHGIGGTWGAIATGLFATKAINPAGADGLFYGNPSLVGKQIIAIAACYVLAAVATFIILKVIGLVFTLRVTPEEEEAGMDISLHGEDAYRDLTLGGTTVNTGKHVVAGSAAEINAVN